MKLTKLLSIILSGVLTTVGSVVAFPGSVHAEVTAASSRAAILKPGETIEFTNNTTSSAMEVDNGYWNHGYYDKLDVAMYGSDNTLSGARMGAERSSNLLVFPGARAVVSNKGDSTIALDAITKEFKERADGSTGVVISDADFSYHRVDRAALNIVKVAVGDNFDYKNTTASKVMLYVSDKCDVDYYYNNSAKASSYPNSSSFSTTLDPNDRIVVKNSGTNDLYIYSGAEVFNPYVTTGKYMDNRTVDKYKIWVVKFTGTVGMDDVTTTQGITLTDSAGNKIDTGIQLGQDSKTVIITAPQGGYTPGESYILTVGNKTHSSKGKALKNEYKLHFNIEK